MGCILEQGYGSTCETKKTKNGLQGSVYLFNLVGSDNNKIQFTEDVDGTVSAITLATGDQGYKLDGSKLMHTFSPDVSVPTKGNQFYVQNLNLKVIESTALDLKFVDSVLRAEALTAVIEDYNGKFIILGTLNGLNAAEGTLKTFDVDPTADVGTTIPLVAEAEDHHYQYFFDTDYATTKQALEDLMSPAS